MVKIPSYLQRAVSGNFHFRIAVPYPLRPYFGKLELKRSLRTPHRTEAIRLSRVLANDAELAFENAREELVKKKKKKLAARPSPKCVRAVTDGPYTPVMPHHTVTNDGKVYIRYKPVGPSQNMLVSEVSIGTDGSVNLKGLELDPDKPEAEAKLFKSVVELAQNKVDGLQPGAIDSSELLSVLIDAYCEEKVREGSWTKKSEHENRAIFDMFIRIVGDGPIASMNFERARDYKATLTKLPPNINKNPLFKSKSIQEIMALNPEKKMAIATINKNLSQVSALFEWGIRNGFNDKNYFSGMRLKKDKQAREERSVFEQEDLRKIMIEGKYGEQQVLHPHYFWLPWIGLLTGARLNEICQLYLDDIREEDGVWVFDINDKYDKQLKTLSSKRLIPIHSGLIDRGFLGYVEHLRKRKETRLFPVLKKGKNGYAHSASRWFSDFKNSKQVGISDTKKNFHSFRHTVTDHLIKKDETKEKIGAILGHSDESMTTGRYGKGYEAQVLRKVVERLEFDL
jgi:integrase